MTDEVLADEVVDIAASNGDSNGHVESPLPMLSAADILGAPDLTEEVMGVPEWGGSIKVKAFSKKQQQEIRTLATVDEVVDSDRLETFMFLRGVVEPHFTDDQYELLRDKNAGVIDRILTKIMGLSGMTQEALATAQKKFPD